MLRRPSPEAQRQRNAARKAENLRALCVPVSEGARGVYRTSVECKPNPKAPEPVRSEAYRRLVAAMPCANCRISGYSQAAHPPATARGKKESDVECFPLCGPRPGVEGCHTAFDQMRLVPGHARRTQAEKWAAQTRAAIRRIGWPANLEDNGK